MNGSVKIINGFLGLLVRLDSITPRLDSITPTLHRTNWDQIWLKCWEMSAVFGCGSLSSFRFAVVPTWHVQVASADSYGVWFFGVQPQFLESKPSFGLLLPILQRSGEHLTRRPRPPTLPLPASLAEPVSSGWTPQVLHTPAPLQKAVCDVHAPRQRTTHTVVRWTTRLQHVFLNSWLPPTSCGQTAAVPQLSPSSAFPHRQPPLASLLPGFVCLCF